MTAHQNVGTPPDTRADRAPLHRGRRRPAMRWIAHSVLFVALAVGIFCLLPRLGGLTRDAAGLRHARPAFLVAAIVAQAVSLGCYAQIYRRVLAALGADPVPAGRGRHPGHLLRQSPNPVRFGDRQKEGQWKARRAAGWLTAFRALTSAEQGVFPGSRNILPAAAGPSIQR